MLKLYLFKKKINKLKKLFPPFHLRSMSTRKHSHLMNYPFGQIDDQSTDMTVKMSAIPTIGFQFSVLNVLSLQRKLRAN